MNTNCLLDRYQRLADLTARMLAAARASDWDRLTALEADCSHITGELARLETDAVLPEPLRTRKLALIRQVLANDAAIRELVSPWLARLGTLLGGARRAHRVESTYGAAIGR